MKQKPTFPHWVLSEKHSIVENWIPTIPVLFKVCNWWLDIWRCLWSSWFLFKVPRDPYRLWWGAFLVVPGFGSDEPPLTIVKEKILQKKEFVTQLHDCALSISKELLIKFGCWKAFQKKGDCRSMLWSITCIMVYFPALCKWWHPTLQVFWEMWNVFDEIIYQCKKILDVGCLIFNFLIFCTKWRFPMIKEHTHCKATHWPQARLEREARRRTKTRLKAEAKSSQKWLRA